MNKFLNNYFKNIAIFLNNSEKDINKLIQIQKIFKSTAKKRKKIIFCGNGGSAATSSHVAVDLTKNAKIRAINFNEADLITCFSNDYGYESWVSSAVKFYADPGDVLVLISVSGKSKNLVNALKFANKKKMKTICFTGMNKNNPLNKNNKKGINIWINSRSYNQIEIIHHMYLLALVDMCIGKTVYPPN